jgi:hypothetical protein
MTPNNGAWRSEPARRWVRGRLSSVPSPWWRAAAALLACGLVGAVVGVFAEPPGGVESGSESGASQAVLVTPVNPAELESAHVPRSNGGVPPKAGYWRGPGDEYGGLISATGVNPSTALDFAASSGIRYAVALTRHENRLMRKRSDPARVRELQKSVIRQPGRFRVEYSPAALTGEAATSFPRGPWRTGLIGVMVGVLLLGAGRMAATRRWLPATATGLAIERTGRLPATIGSAAAGVAVAGILAALASTSTTAYTVVLVGLILSAAFAFTRAEGGRAVRALVGGVIVLSAIRGALLGLSNAINLPDGLTTVNAIQPAIIAGCALAVLLDRRGRLPRDSRPLLVGWVVIAAVAILDLATQTVGFHVYAIGLAQYLTYPTLAVLAWLAMERGDPERLVRLFVLVGAVVAVSVFAEALGLIRFVEAAAPNGDIVTGNRYGGATGSYLHASIFLGTTAVLALALVLERWRRRDGVIAAVMLAMIVAAMGLTLSRGGFAIAAVGALALFAGASRLDRRRLLGTGLAVILAAAVLGVAGGVTPAKLGSRLGSGLSASGDPGNAERFSRMHAALNDFRDLPVAEKAFGEGLAATGNARVVAGFQALAVESYPLKLLLEVGLVGALAIGAYMVWAAARFAKTSIRGPNRLLRSAAAAGLGLSAYGLLYPTLEVQLLAMTWWMLLVVCLATRAPGFHAGHLATNLERDGVRAPGGVAATVSGNGARAGSGQRGESEPQPSEGDGG